MNNDFSIISHASPAQECKLPGALQAVSVALGSATVAIDLRKVTSIVMPQTTAMLAGLPEGVGGVITLRGRIIPVIDMRGTVTDYKIDGASDTASHERIVVVHSDGVIAGLLVNAIVEFIRIPHDTASLKLMDVRATLASCVDGGIKALRHVQQSTIRMSPSAYRSYRMRAA